MVMPAPARSGSRHGRTGSGPVSARRSRRTQAAARYAVLEVDELYLSTVAESVRPEAVVLLNLTRDQLDRGSEVRAVAAHVSAALARRPETLVVANADDPLVVAATGSAARVV